MPEKKYSVRISAAVVHSLLGVNPSERVHRGHALFFEDIVVELKALERISGKEESQILNYLKSTGCKMGVVINFGAKHSLEWKRYVY